MNEHLSHLEQDEYLLGERNSRTMRHLAVCSSCRLRLSNLELELGCFKRVASEWSTECVAARPVRTPLSRLQRVQILYAGWAFASLLLILSFLMFSSPHAQDTQAVSSDAQSIDKSIDNDALLQQVDEQISSSVPDSMKSLRHLVAANPNQQGVDRAENSRHADED